MEAFLIQCCFTNQRLSSLTQVQRCFCLLPCCIHVGHASVHMYVHACASMSMPHVHAVATYVRACMHVVVSIAGSMLSVAMRKVVVNGLS